ncbi:MAG: cellulose synthase/poly-beta-1,6-N-acetylglucosamine synthase-like glycosyltransferase, partial [Yoonia sp.]
EKAIASQLLDRIKLIDYPRDKLDICLVMEIDDETTREALRQTTLPTWLRPILVPKGTLKTKPRAMNYALDFARGSLVGVYDAEDAPAPDQLRKAARHFANRGDKVACLQGVLDYYNAPANWVTRCFTLEYAGWFRVGLPGLERLGLVVPLGGTTLFFRRNVLERIGAWDAHNVTEDADLGVRLARHGYRTELIATTTQEEANGRFWPWIKQRSRWLKGYAITYGVHMRDPGLLYRELGARRFWGFQILFAGTLSQFVLAPVLWSFWVMPFGIAHPMATYLQGWVLISVVGLFIISELTNMFVFALGVTKAKKMWLIRWIPTMHFYFPMAAVAAYKGFYELTCKPFYWDKTAHGILPPTKPTASPVRPTSNE